MPNIKFVTIYSFVIIVTVLVSCSKVNNNVNSNLSIVEVKKKVVGTKEVVSLEKIVILDVSKDCFFGEITCLVPTNSGYYLLDDRYSKSIFKFDIDGKLCSKFGNVGKGPGEFLRARWISVNEEKSQLIIYDSDLRKLLIFNSKSSLFLKEIKLEFNARSFETLKDNTGFIFYTCFAFNGYPVKSRLIAKGEDYQIIVTDNEGKIRSLNIPYPNTFRGQNFIGVKGVFSAYGDSLSLFTQYNDTLFAIGKNGKLHPKFIIDYGNKNQKLSTDFINFIGPQPVNFQRNDLYRSTSGIFHLASQLQTDKHIQLIGIQDKSLFRYLVDKGSCNILDLVENDQTLKFGFRASDSNYFYSIAFFDAFSKIGSNSFNLYPDMLKKALETAGIYHNPIILVWKIKSF